MFRLHNGQYAKYWISEGILFFVYQTIPLLDLQIAQAIVKERMQFQAGQSYPILCDSRGIQDATKEARDFLAMEGSSLAKAVAIVDNRQVGHCMSNVYILRNRPLIPTAIFNETHDAIRFLKEFL